MRRTLLGFCILILFFIPFQKSYANEDLQPLFVQIKLLLEEVERLQSLLDVQAFQESDFEPLTHQEQRDIISDSVVWFKNAQEDSGHFAYEYVPYEDRYLPLDNIVRQGGGLFALGEVARKDTDNKLELKETLQKGIRYFDGLSVRGDHNGYTFRCVGNSSINQSCQLGATALVITGLISTLEAYPELQETYDDLVHDYGRYMIAMKKDGEGFMHGFTPGAEPSSRESSFSNGEALMALVRYYQYAPHDETKQVIDDSFAYFASDAVEFDFPLYLWAMAAIKDMHALWGKQEYVEYVDAYTSWRINGFAHRKGTNHNMCAYVEGVASAYSVLEGNIDDSRLQLIKRELDFWLRKSRELQIQEEDRLRVIYNEDGTATFGEIANMNLAKGGFLTGKNELTQRIDFTQHCITSYLQNLVDIERAEF